ncbi:uncharacterized protein LOC142890323 isoform X2 [Nelusetta ayraudi]|uniref:uncharacterized protein LOC142890323 isoform X2 n=1 Tax=Nelusetta ayraudi TaxID=303726 RepID=UPI003F728886
MDRNLSPGHASPDHRGKRAHVSSSLSELRQLVEARFHILQPPREFSALPKREGDHAGRAEPWRLAGLSEELTFDLLQLRRQTERELGGIQAQLARIEDHRQLLSSELCDLRGKKQLIEQEVKADCSLQASTCQLRVCRNLQASVAERLLQSERLLFQEEALSALHDLLTQDLHRYQEETHRLSCFRRRVLQSHHRSTAESELTGRVSKCSMQGKSETEQNNNMESEMDSNRQPDSPSEEEPVTPRPVMASQNPKYQLFLSNDLKTNGVSGKDADGPGGGGSLGENGPTRLPPWETKRLAVHRGSSESLALRDLDSATDRVGVIDSPQRVFNSPYSSALSLDYNPVNRMSEFKVQGTLSPATSEMNLYTRSISPGPMGGALTPLSPIPTLTPMGQLGQLGQPRQQRFSTYDTLLRRRTDFSNPVPQVVHTHYAPMRPGALGGPNRQDFVEELSKQLDVCQKRNQFLEAESVEMDKERNQIRFEMRGLLVNNEDLLRTNAQLNNEMKRLREQMIEIDRELQARDEKIRGMEIEVTQARSMMVEANSQEYAFNFLQQSLKNRIQDAEESLEKQTQHSQSLSEKLWHAERQLEELEIDHDTKDKKRSELNSTIVRLETELAEALQSTTQSATELSLQQKLREDSELRVEEMEESLLEKEQELQRQLILISKLQGEVSGKLIDKEQTLEEEIQLRERIDLQRKQAERMVDDLKIELDTANQGKEELAKQIKQAQEKMIDLESEVEELHDSEHRWAAKQKRAIEQAEQLQLKLIQEKDLNDQLELNKATIERQLRELRLEMDELQSSRVQEDVISRAEIRVKELENVMRTEERNKVVLANTVAKLERRINELTDQMEEEHRISTEQKDLMAQRIRSLKRQLNETEEEASRKDAQYRHTQRELAEERETNSRLQRQLLEQHLQTKRKETLSIRHTLDSLRRDLSVDDEDDEEQQQQQQQEEEQEGSFTKV